jgi:hypothetical protein
MKEVSSKAGRGCRRGRTVFLALVFSVITALPASASNLVKYSLCDIRVLYLFDDPGSIEWPTVYYLNDMFGCRVDLVTTKQRTTVQQVTQSLPDRELHLHTLYFSEADTAGAALLVGELFYERFPDIIIFGDHGKDAWLELVKSAILNLPKKEPRLFNILKVYRRYDAASDNDHLQGRVVLNGRELLHRYGDRMALEVPVLLPRFDPRSYRTERMIRYRLLKNHVSAGAYSDNFLSGFSSFRLLELIDSLFVAGPMKETMQKQAKEFISNFNASLISVGQKQVGFIIEGYRQLRELNRHESATAEIGEYRNYLQRLLSRAERAALDAVGISWEGRIVLRDSPHGPRLKFLASISADGPKEVEVTGFRFHPYWDTVAVVLDTVPKIIAPHQSYAKEFLVDIDRAYLEGEKQDSLEFTVGVAYGHIPLVFSSKLPIWEAPDLRIEFEPDFHFLEPFPGLEVDRVVSSVNLKAIIAKPYDYSGTVRLNLTTPRGLFAGAYRKDVSLEKGMTTETVRIPFTISNLFELGIQAQTIELLVDDRLVAADTGRIRIASCAIADTIKIGFLPDSAGMLEDILRMTGATYRPLTDRSLITADLDAYNVIVIGPGSFRDYPSLRLMKGRFEEYLRYGGSLALLGQPEDWPGEILPVSFVPTVEVVDADGINNRIAEARVLSQPYSISEKNLLSSFYRKREVSPAVISPAEKVLVTPRGATVLSVSRLGEGQIIFCGLPLLEMITKLDIDAIHLFANILNY